MSILGPTLPGVGVSVPSPVRTKPYRIAHKTGSNDSPIIQANVDLLDIGGIHLNHGDSASAISGPSRESARIPI